MRCFNVNCKRRVMAAVTAAGLLAPSRSEADNDVWKTAVSGTWSAGLNWVDGSSPSSIFDRAMFNLPGAYTVSFTTDPDPIEKLTLTNAANVTFASSSRPGNPIVPRTLRLVPISSDVVALAVGSGASLTLGATSGAFPSSSHPFHLTTGGRLLLDHTATLNVKFGSVVTTHFEADILPTDELNGTVNVSVGSLIQKGHGAIGSGAAGVVNVSGAGSRLITANLLDVGRFSGQGTLNITSGGLVECLDGKVAGGSSGATGTVTVTGSGSLWKTTNSLEISGAVNIQPGGTVTVGQDTSVLSGGLLRLQGGIFDTREFHPASGFEWTSGTYRVGTHHLSLLNQAGTLAPGHSAGSTTILGNYTQQSAGTLEIEIGGAAQGTEYDVVNITGNALMFGQLDVKLIGGFVPSPSQTFVILSADEVAGVFSNVSNGQRLSSAGGGSFRVNYGPGSAFDPTLIVLSAFQSSLSGDGDVDGNDFLTWQRGGLPTPLSATDLAAWKANFGAGSAAAAIAAPEPPSATCFILALWACRYGQPRRRVPLASCQCEAGTRSASQLERAVCHSPRRVRSALHGQP